MVYVSKKKGESKDTLFRKFTRMFIEENVVDEVRKKQFYKKPSLQRKEREKELLKARHRSRTFGRNFHSR
ncbi:30S ribosomal protein S21 [Candidatus Roizmanbacteria bacterium RIFCSPHIGHO2_01_FULL_35_10]|uniref:Small ribosomal subunit protein bS21 n=1 Tax=Candidatus Roizmanbacteria bacterium RIFCSPLOWO2_01_FULL_35_13 TaxID=1802055 RepID=A0A1F7IAZ1_9BACT|nr:MAG: 30S ribosomal protein S21 [Candidatus Roizmanbacteria bacterium RIFCSPHIGHO2_01_FULL_35_10]OGK40535.1 MAG: 30S ribosomal protein S21 [Candidatus Roizmanbacteria bacterium RIFCSPLOWO2_01_FULL_35_13]